MSAFNPNIRRQRAFPAGLRKRLAVLGKRKLVAGVRPTDGGESEADKIRAALDAGPPPLRPAEAEPERSKRADRKAKRARRHDAVKAMLAKAGVKQP